MTLDRLADNPGARSKRTRIGRGPGSGKGRTGGRGMKGQKSRSGVSLLGFEGGQMPLYRRLPKRGFNNPRAKTYAHVNLGRLQSAIDAKKLDPAKPIDGAALVAAGVVRRVKDGVRLLAKGALNTKVTIEVAGASKAALGAIEKIGGTVTLSAAAGDDGKAADKPKRGASRRGKAKGAAAEGKSDTAET